MAYCPECGFQIERTDVFCGSCGFKMTGGDHLNTFIAPAGFDVKSLMAEMAASDSAPPESEKIAPPEAVPLPISPALETEKVAPAVENVASPIVVEHIALPIIEKTPEVVAPIAENHPPKRATGELSFNKTSANFALNTMDNFDGEPNKTQENFAVSTLEKLDVPPPSPISGFADDEDFTPAPVLEPEMPVFTEVEEPAVFVPEIPAIKETFTPPQEKVFIPEIKIEEPVAVKEYEPLAVRENVASAWNSPSENAKTETPEIPAPIVETPKFDEPQLSPLEKMFALRQAESDKQAEPEIEEPPQIETFAPPVVEPQVFPANEDLQAEIRRQIAAAEAEKIAQAALLPSAPPVFTETEAPRIETPKQESAFTPVFEPVKEVEAPVFAEKFTLDVGINFVPQAVPVLTPPIEAENIPPAKPVFGSLAETLEDSPPKFEAAKIPIKEVAPIITPPVAPVSNPEEPRGTTVSGNGVGTQGGGKSSKLKPLEDGTFLNNRYRIVRRIGGGGMGAVYLAHDKNLGETSRAVKEMIQAYVDEEQQEKAVQDFKRESLLLSSLEHPAIPTIYDYFLDEKHGRFYLVMKYIAGGDLSSRLRATPNGRLEEIFITEMAAEVADVLSYLHNYDPPIVYRDLKPSNIMIDSTSERAMLIDFGIARWVKKEEKGVTAVGTMGYAPPELFSGNADQRSDIYSLGATMFHLLTGADPQNNPLLIFDFSKNPRPRQLNQSLSVEIEKVLMRSVEYNPDLRFQTAKEMRDTLLLHAQNLRAGRATYTTESSIKISPLTAQTPPAVFCGFCGGKILATDLFCAYCGTRQPEAERAIAAMQMPQIPSVATARLVIVGTNELDPPAYSLEKEDNLVGRRDPQSNIFPEVDLTRYDPSIKISRKHARIWKQGQIFLIEDLGSSNGTLVFFGGGSDSKRLLPHQPHALASGDKVKIGETTLHFFSN